jgi:hypothetical protein
VAQNLTASGAAVRGRAGGDHYSRPFPGRNRTSAGGSVSLRTGPARPRRPPRWDRRRCVHPRIGTARSRRRPVVIRPGALQPAKRRMHPNPQPNRTDHRIAPGTACAGLLRPGGPVRAFSSRWGSPTGVVVPAQGSVRAAPFGSARFTTIDTRSVRYVPGEGTVSPRRSAVKPAQGPCQGRGAFRLTRGMAIANGMAAIRGG